MPAAGSPQIRGLRPDALSLAMGEPAQQRQPAAGPGLAAPDVGVPGRAEGGAAPGGRCGFISAPGCDARRRQGAASNRRRRGDSPPHCRPRPARPAAAGLGAPALAGCSPRFPRPAPATATGGHRRRPRGKKEKEEEKTKGRRKEEERGGGRERVVGLGGGPRAAGS